MDTQTKALALGFGLVMLAQIASLVVKKIQSGASSFGHLDKTIQVPLHRNGLDWFMNVFQQRLASLGFQRQGTDHTYIQGGAHLGDLGSFAHSKTNKLLTLQIHEPAADQVV